MGEETTGFHGFLRFLFISTLFKKKINKSHAHGSVKFYFSKIADRVFFSRCSLINNKKTMIIIFHIFVVVLFYYTNYFREYYVIEKEMRHRNNEFGDFESSYVFLTNINFVREFII